MIIALYITLGFSATVLAIIFGSLYWKEIKTFVKNQWFNILFSLCFAVLGFIIMDNKVAGKIAGAILFSALGFGAAAILKLILSNIKSKTLVVIIEILLCALLLLFAVTREYGVYKEPKRNNHIGNGWDQYDYDNDGDINQGEWEDAIGDALDKYGY